MPWNRIKTNRLVLANGLGKSLAAIQQSRVKGLIGVPEHLEAQDYMAIIIPKKWKDLIDGFKVLALYQQSDTRPSDSMWNILSEHWDRSAAVLPLTKVRIHLE
jgi:hypothetical protein